MFRYLLLYEDCHVQSPDRQFPYRNGKIECHLQAILDNTLTFGNYKASTLGGMKKILYNIPT